MNHTISIVIPVYNVEKYLAECLDSILDQRYRDLEAIVIDDGSTDASGDICDQYAKQDPRVHVFHEKNSGVSAVRNLGVKRATGDWVMFLDSDDHLYPDALGQLMDGALKYDADIVSGTYTFEYQDANVPVQPVNISNGIWEIDSKRLTGEMLIRTHEYREMCPACFVPWGKIIKRQLIIDHNVGFELGIHPHEDGLFNMDLYQYAGRQVVLDIPVVYYRQRLGASTRNKQKNYFENNKKFIEASRKRCRHEDGQSILKDNDYYVLGCKFFVLSMSNLWPSVHYSPWRAAKRLKDNLNAEPFRECLENVDLSNLPTKDFAFALRKSMNYAKKKNIVMLLLVALAAEIGSLLGRLRHSQNEPFS